MSFGLALGQILTPLGIYPRTWGFNVWFGRIFKGWSWQKEVYPTQSQYLVKDGDETPWEVRSWELTVPGILFQFERYRPLLPVSLDWGLPPLEKVESDDGSFYVSGAEIREWWENRVRQLREEDPMANAEEIEAILDLLKIAE